MTKVDNQDFKNSTRCWICDNDYVDNDVKVRDRCHITTNYITHRLQYQSKYKSQNFCRISHLKKNIILFLLYKN